MLTLDKFLLHEKETEGTIYMAKTQKGKKIVTVKPHKRAKPGSTKKTKPVRRHRRSTPE